MRALGINSPINQLNHPSVLNTTFLCIGAESQSLKFCVQISQLTKGSSRHLELYNRWNNPSEADRI